MTPEGPVLIHGLVSRFVSSYKTLGGDYRTFFGPSRRLSSPSLPKVVWVKRL